MPIPRPESSDARVIAHVDMDCFYVQVEQRKQPELKGLPTAVVQYNEWKGGGLIAVSYEARSYGVKRSMRGDEAKNVCPQIQLVQVPVSRGKADLTIYRNAGSEVVSILARKGRCERASIDEVYLDLTDAAETMLAEAPPESLNVIDDEVLNSHILGLVKEDEGDGKKRVKEWLRSSDADHRNKLLACAVFIVAELRMEVLKQTGFTCSAGIAHNKMLAKLTSGMNKPAQQTVVPDSSVKELLYSLPIKKMKQLGGKLGSSLQIDLRVNTVGDLLQFSEEKLQELYGINTGTWLWNIARGISGEEVQGRLLPKSHGSGKSFPGPRALKKLTTVQHWLNQLSEELSERLCSDLELNKRIAHTLTLHASAYKPSDSESNKKFPSKSCPLRYGASKIQEDASNLFQAALREYMGSYGTKNQGNKNGAWAITGLSVSASKIVAIPTGTCSIMKYFHGQSTSCASSKQAHDNLIQEPTSVPPSSCRSYSEVKSLESQIELHAEETPTFIEPASSHEERQYMWQEQHPSCSSMQAPENLNQSTTLSQSGSKEFSGYDQNAIPEIPKNESQIKKGKKGQKRNVLEDKTQGTCSILNFFKTQDASHTSLEQRHTESINDIKSLSSHEQNPTELQIEGSMAETGTNSDNNEERREVWSYKMEDIDPSVIDELPPEIQREVRTWLRPHKRSNIEKRASSNISHYFLPTKNT